MFLTKKEVLQDYLNFTINLSHFYQEAANNIFQTHTLAAQRSLLLSNKAVSSGICFTATLRTTVSVKDSF